MNQHPDPVITPGRARTRAIRRRMAETGEPFVVAARHVDQQHTSAQVPAISGRRYSSEWTPVTGCPLSLVGWVPSLDEITADQQELRARFIAGGHHTGLLVVVEKHGHRLSFGIRTEPGAGHEVALRACHRDGWTPANPAATLAGLGPGDDVWVLRSVEGRAYDTEHWMPADVDWTGPCPGLCRHGQPYGCEAPCPCAGPCRHRSSCDVDGCDGRLRHCWRSPSEECVITTWTDAYRCSTCAAWTEENIELPDRPWGTLALSSDGRQEVITVFPRVGPPPEPYFAASDYATDEAGYVTLTLT